MKKRNRDRNKMLGSQKMAPVKQAKCPEVQVPTLIPPLSPEPPQIAPSPPAQPDIYATNPGFAADATAPRPIESRGPEFVAGATDTGLKRANNEDGYLCDPERGLFIVADGMGGMAAGEKASEDALNFLGQYLTSEKIALALDTGEDAVTALFRDALMRSHKSILRIVEANPDWRGMGSTIVVGLLGKGMLHVANLGDSRAYLMRNRTIRVLTKDHSVAAALVEQGEITEEEARTHFLRNHLTGVLGGGLYREPACMSVPLCPGDRIVLCSDGLWDYVEDDDIAKITAAYEDPRETVTALIEAAYAANAPDNVTMIVMHIGEEHV